MVAESEPLLSLAINRGFGGGNGSQLNTCRIHIASSRRLSRLRSGWGIADAPYSFFTVVTFDRLPFLTTGECCQRISRTD